MGGQADGSEQERDSSVETDLMRAPVRAWVRVRLVVLSFSAVRRADPRDSYMH